MPKLKYLKHHFGIQPGTIVNEPNEKAVRELTAGPDPKAVIVPDTTPTTAETEQKAVTGDVANKGTVRTANK